MATSDKFTLSGKTYCKTCYDIRKEQAQEYKDLISDICTYFELDRPTGLIVKQVKDYKGELGYTNNGMRYTLWYCTAILNMRLEVKYGIAIVRYRYEEAERYFIQQERIRQSTINNDIEVKTKVVKIKTNRNKPKDTKFLIDISDLFRGDGDVK